MYTQPTWKWSIIFCADELSTSYMEKEEDEDEEEEEGDGSCLFFTYCYHSFRQYYTIQNALNIHIKRYKIILNIEAGDWNW